MADIWSYVADDASEQTATRLIATIAERLVAVAQFPRTGVERPQLGKEVRVAFQDKYAIYYVVQPAGILVLRVLHGSRDVDAISEQGGILP